MTHQYKLTDPTKATLFLDITSGGVGLTVWRGESLLFQRNMHSGSLRVMESFNQKSTIFYIISQGLLQNIYIV